MDWRVWALFCCVSTDNRDSPKLCIFTMYTVTLAKISSSIRRLWAHERINIVVYCMGKYRVNKVERTTLGSHDLAVSVFQNFLPISRSLSKCKISNTLTAISSEVLLIHLYSCTWQLYMHQTLIIWFKCSHNLRVEFKMITNVLLQLVKMYIMANVPSLVFSLRDHVKI